MKTLSVMAMLLVLANGCSPTKSHDTMKIPEDWPELWTGNTEMDFMENGRIRCEIFFEAPLGETPMQNYAEIRRRWTTVWPAAQKKLISMLKEYGEDSELKDEFFKMEIRIPAEPIGEGVRWAISAIRTEGAKEGGYYNSEFIGWAVDEGSSQAYF